jgi:hypothetical protein
MRHLLAIATLAASTLLTGCITSYSGFDTSLVDKAPAISQQQGHLRYSIYGGGLLGGQIAVREVFDRDAPFTKVEQIVTPIQPDGYAAPPQTPTSGLYVKTTVENMPPSIPAGLAAYISYSTLFLLPFWSTEDGSRLLFDVYRDGEHQKRFEYALNRSTYGWAPLLLLVWVNAFKPSEQDAFRAATRQFLNDAAPLLKTP